MAEFVRMPQKGLTEESAVLTQWHVKKGDFVKKGQLLFSLETGKAVFDVEAETSGIVLEILVKEGEEVPIKEVVCVIGEKEEPLSLEEIKCSSPERTVQSSSLSQGIPTTAEGNLPHSAKQVSLSSEGKEPIGGIPCSPRARKLAAKHRIPLNRLKGSGPRGRILEEDVLHALNQVDAAISTQTQKGGYHTPVSILTTVFDATQILDFQERFNNGLPETKKLRIIDFIFFAFSRVLSMYLSEYSVGGVPLSIGFGIPTHQGLVFPVIEEADHKSLKIISEELKSRESDILKQELKATVMGQPKYSILNFHLYKNMTPILNPSNFNQEVFLSVSDMEYRRKKSLYGMIDYPSMELVLIGNNIEVDKVPLFEILDTLATMLENFYLLLAR